MFTTCCPLILASASPRRREYLSRLGLRHQVIPAAIDETAEPGEPPQAFACRMAATKAAAVANDYPDACVLAADTVVALEGQLFGKPQNREDALAMLSTLQGRTHLVTTAYALVGRSRQIKTVDSVTTAVSFGTFSTATLLAYIETGEPMDKAGAYGIQGIGAFLVESITGSCSNVVGLPVHAVVRKLLELGVVATH